MKKIAVTNQKGGVGKTTTAINLATAVALTGVKTLVVDLDPQANVTSGFGIEKPSLENNVYAAIIGDRPLRDVILKTDVPNLDLAPSGLDLVGAELELASIEGRESRLKAALAAVENDYQFAFFDGPPSLGLITLNALTAADSVLVPLQCEYYALEGLSQLMKSIEFVKSRFNPNLTVEGMVFTMYDSRSNLTRQVREEVEKHFHGKTYRNWIPRNVRLAEAPGFGKPGVIYDPQSVGARAYKLLADEFLQNNGIRPYEVTPSYAKASEGGAETLKTTAVGLPLRSFSVGGGLIMASTHKALGRGLEALFAASAAKTTTPVADAGTTAVADNINIVREISVDKIRPNRHQPRTYFDLEALEELSQSIRQHGLAQPLLVTETATPGEYELVAGERRLRASKLAGLPTVPCTVKKMSNRDRFEVALIENIQRQDLNALEEAVALDGLMREYSLTQEDVANAIGKSRSAVANVLRFLKLHENVQTALRSGAISEGHAKCLAGVPEHAEQLRLLEKITAEDLSVRELEALINAGGKRKTSVSSVVKPASVEVQKYQEQLQRALGRKVELQTNGKKGWLKFEFYTPEDLDELCGKLGLKI